MGPLLDTLTLHISTSTEQQKQLLLDPRFLSGGSSPKRSLFNPNDNYALIFFSLIYFSLKSVSLLPFLCESPQIMWALEQTSCLGSERSPTRSFVIKLWLESNHHHHSQSLILTCPRSLHFHLFRNQTYLLCSDSLHFIEFGPLPVQSNQFVQFY